MSDAAIVFDSITVATGWKISRRLAAGKRLKIMCSTDEVRVEFRELLAGGSAPQRGQLRYFGRDLYAVSEDERLALHRRVGIVPHEGGLISNLKGWENVILPEWYHHGRDASALEEQASSHFDALGFSTERLRGFMGTLPERLTVYETRAVALVRTLLTDPEVVIYEAPFSGLDRGAAARVLELSEAFHAARPGRATLYLLPDEPFSERVDADDSIVAEI